MEQQFKGGGDGSQQTETESADSNRPTNTAPERKQSNDAATGVGNQLSATATFAGSKPSQSASGDGNEPTETNIGDDIQRTEPCAGNQIIETATADGENPAEKATADGNQGKEAGVGKGNKPAQSAAGVGNQPIGTATCDDNETIQKATYDGSKSTDSAIADANQAAQRSTGDVNQTLEADKYDGNETTERATCDRNQPNHPAAGDDNRPSKTAAGGGNHPSETATVDGNQTTATATRDGSKPKESRTDYGNQLTKSSGSDDDQASESAAVDGKQPTMTSIHDGNQTPQTATGHGNKQTYSDTAGDDQRTEMDAGQDNNLLEAATADDKQPPQTATVDGSQTSQVATGDAKQPKDTANIDDNHPTETATSNGNHVTDTIRIHGNHTQDTATGDSNQTTQMPTDGSDQPTEATTVDGNKQTDSTKYEGNQLVEMATVDDNQSATRTMYATSIPTETTKVDEVMENEDWLFDQREKEKKSASIRKNIARIKKSLQESIGICLEEKESFQLFIIVLVLGALNASAIYTFNQVEDFYRDTHWQVAFCVIVTLLLGAAGVLIFFCRKRIKQVQAPDSGGDSQPTETATVDFNQQTDTESDESNRTTNADTTEDNQLNATATVDGNMSTEIATVDDKLPTKADSETTETTTAVSNQPSGTATGDGNQSTERTDKHTGDVSHPTEPPTCDAKQPREIATSDSDHVQLIDEGGAGVTLMQEPSKDVLKKENSGNKPSDSATLPSSIGNNPPPQKIAPSDHTNIHTDPTKSSESVNPPNILSHLALNNYYPMKISLKEMLEISTDKLNDTKPTGPEGIGWHFLQRVLMANSTSRNPDWPLTKQVEKHTEVNEDWNNEEDLFDWVGDNDGQITGVNPLDVTVAVFLCADHSLRQELMRKMSLCQFALPFLLPEGDTVTFLLWAMRSIVKQWRPHSLVSSSGFVEESVVTAAIPTFSFIRLGRCSVSKSKMLNLTLSRTEHQQNFFLHSEMEYGNLPRGISDGLAEICWYLPGGKPNLDVLPEACSFINLRGEARAHQKQAQFLAKIANALFVFIDVFDEEKILFLTSLAHSPTRFFLIINSSSKEQKISKQQSRELLTALNLHQHQVLSRKGKNDAQFVDILRSTIKSLLAPGEARHQRIDEMTTVASEIRVQVDENDPEMRRGQKSAEDLLNDIDTSDIAAYKQVALPLHGKSWQIWSEAEKEKSRMKHRKDKPTDKYIEELNKTQTDVRKTQRENGVSKQMKQFIAALKQSSGVKQGFFVQWLKLDLDRKSRQIMLSLRSDYKMLEKNTNASSAEMQILDQKMAASSLGLEHFMRELGQVYEICATQEYQIITKNIFKTLPGVAADLMLGGFPLELIDGDVSNIPLQWVSAVLEEVNRKVGGNPRVFVLTVLGVQSTGKSTLLNTMFGLQFAVSSGRCTRGAYMQLIKVTGDLVTELGCDFILVIDTEGLKAPELMSLEDSYEHDNELATLVIGLSDVTLVNMSMENSTEMKDVLQIVVHSLIRMREIGKRPICQFVHQNVAGVSAYEQNRRDRQKLLEQLDEMTEAAARMEKLERVKFCDVMDYDTDGNNWYIPGLWHGVPPMAAVSTGYSEQVFELKKSIVTCFRNRNKVQKALTFPDFIEWMSGLWEQIKCENFIFSFQNSLFAEAYSQLSRKYSEWDLELRTFAHTWTIEAENTIKNRNTEQELHQLQSTLNPEIGAKMVEMESAIVDKLTEYYESRDHNVHLMEPYRVKFQTSIHCLCDQLRNESIQKCNEVVLRSQALDKVDKIWDEFNKQIESEVMKLLKKCKTDEKAMNDCELQNEFKTMWTRTLQKLNYRPSQEVDIERNIENLLRSNMPQQGKVINEVRKEKALSQLGLDIFDVKQKHIDQISWTKKVKAWFQAEPSTVQQGKHLSHTLEGQCKHEIDDIAKRDMHYDSKYCVDFLSDLDRKIENISEQNFKMSEIYQAEFKLHMCGYAARKFTAMHKAFVDKHNPQKRLEEMEPKYLELFKQIYTKQDMAQKGAESFSESCFMPAVREAIIQRLGQRIVVDMKQNDSKGEYTIRNCLTVALLVHLKVKDDSQQYIKYIRDFESFAKRWLRGRVLEYCVSGRKGDVKLIQLAKGILLEITGEAKQVIRNAITQNVSGEARTLLERFIDKLKTKFVIPKDSLKLVVFQLNTKAKNFIDMLLPCIEQAEASLLQELKAWDIRAKIRELTVKPEEEIIKKLISCTKQCPFCKVCCEAEVLVDHQHHSHQHRPQGLGSYHCSMTRILTTNICTASVASDGTFRNSDTNKKIVYYKDYRTVSDYYNSWIIQNSPGSEASSYWKKVFCIFNNQFAEHYSAEPAEIPAGWDIPWDKVKDDLNKAYNVSLETL